jgi:putative hydrolase of the HAD superfamily
MQPSFIFDIGNVLIDFDLPRLMRMISKNSRVPLEDLSGSWTQEDTVAVETGKNNSQDQYRQYADSIGLKWSYDVWKRVWMAIYSINETGMAIVKECRAKGFPLYILSNLAEYNKEAIEMKFNNFFTRFKGSFFSYELGLHKPDPEIFLSVCSIIKAPPEKCVFIDDLHENVHGARSIGMRAIQFTPDRYHSMMTIIGETVSAFVSFP